jgi:hypothetical protein
MTDNQGDRKFAEALAAAVQKMQAESAEVLRNNPEKQAVFGELYSYFLGLAEAQDGAMGEVTIERSGGFTVRFPIFDLTGGAVKTFAGMVAKADVFGITPAADDGIFIDVSVNGLFVPDGGRFAP